MSMFTLAISCLTISNLPWFIDVTFQSPTQYCSLQHRTLLSPPDTSTTEHCFCFVPTAQFFLELLVIALCSSPVACWTPSDLGGGRGGGGLGERGSSSSAIPFHHSPRDSPGKNTGVGCHFLLQWTMFCQNSSLWPVHFGWPCMLWLIAPLSYARPISTTRLWPMKG